MEEDKRISELSVLSACDGNELLPFAKNGDNGAVTTETMREFMQDGVGEKAFELLWIQAGNMNGFKFTSVDWSNKEKPYECNGIRLTREEALKTYILKDNPWMGANGVSTWTCVKLVTNLMPIYRFVGVTINGYSSTIDYFRIAPDGEQYRAALTPTGNHTFPNCIEILGAFDQRQNFDFSSCQRLKKMKLHALSYSLGLSSCWQLDLESFQYMVDNATNTGAITVIVHPAVYNKLTDETNTEWHKVLTDATARKISFATAG